MTWEFWYLDEKPHLDDEGNSYDDEKEWRGDVTLVAEYDPDEVVFMGMGIMFSKRSTYGCEGFPTQNAQFPYDGVEIFWMFNKDCQGCTQYEITDIHSSVEVDFSEGLEKAKGFQVDDTNNWKIDAAESYVEQRSNKHAFNVQIYREFVTKDEDDQDLKIGLDQEFCVYGWYNVYDTDITVQGRKMIALLSSTHLILTSFMLAATTLFTMF